VEPTDISTAFFSDKWGAGGAEVWQTKAPQLLGKRLMLALRDWRQHMKHEFIAEVRSLVLRGATESATSSKDVFSESFNIKKLFVGSNHAALRELWTHYDCESLLATVADEALHSRCQGGREIWELSAYERGLHRGYLQHAHLDYARRNATLRSLHARTCYEGVLRIHVVGGSGLIAVDQLSLTDMFSGQDSSKPTTYLVIQFDGSVDPAVYGDMVPKLTSKPVKRNDKPYYDEWLQTAIRDSRCTAHIELIEKHSFRELVLGCADLDLSALIQSQLTEMVS